MIEHTVIDTPVGRLRLAATDHDLRSVQWNDDAPLPTTQKVASTVLRDAVRQLTEYFAGQRTTFDLPLDPIGTAFQQQAWAALRAIPYGTTISYGEQALRLGDRRKCRAVGMANGQNPLCIVVPCHRVIASDGSLGGFSGGRAAKMWLLDHERRFAPSN